MNSRRRPGYWILGVLAVLHGLALLPLFDVAEGEWGTRLWVAVATLWFLWLIVLTLYPGRSVWKIGALTIIVLFAWGIFKVYNSKASFAFGLPEGFSLVPSEAVSWTRAYLAGRAEAKKDVQQGRLIIEQHGLFAGSGHEVDILRDRYGIEVRATAQCAVDSQILGHAVGYNAISESEIERRYGRKIVQTVFEEGRELDREDRARSE